MLMYSWNIFGESIFLKNKYKSSYTKIFVKAYCKLSKIVLSLLLYPISVLVSLMQT